MSPYTSEDIQYAERVEKRYQREHNLLNTRTSIFSVLQALLIAGNGLIVRSGDAPPPAIAIFAIWVMGFGGSLLWLVLGGRTRAVQRNYSDLLNDAEEKAYKKEHQIHAQSRKDREGTLDSWLPPIHASTILGLVFPIIALMIWVVIGLDHLLDR